MAAPMKILGVPKSAILSGGLRSSGYLRSCCRCQHVTVTTSRAASSLSEEFKKATSQPPSGHARPLFRTTENNPVNHRFNHEGLFYTVPKEDFTRWLGKGLQPSHYQMAKAFTENFLMIRRPAVEVMEYMRAASYDLPVIRYLLYGRFGAGKSMTLSHIIHWCGKQDWLIVHMPWVPAWNRYIREHNPSIYKPGRVDTPLPAAQWLNDFQLMNEPVLKQLDFKIDNKYVWSKREISEPGTPLLEVINFGLARVKYASDIVGVVLKEVKKQASEGKFKCLLAADGINALWEGTVLRREEDFRQFHTIDELTIAYNFKKMLKNDWNGGAVVCTVDEYATLPEKRQSYMPKALLPQEGFELFDPHIPIHVPDYSDKEFLSCLSYYQDRQWIQNPKGFTEEGLEEIKFLSCKNPYELYKVTATW